MPRNTDGRADRPDRPRTASTASAPGSVSSPTSPGSNPGGAGAHEPGRADRHRRATPGATQPVSSSTRTTGRALADLGRARQQRRRSARDRAARDPPGARTSPRATATSSPCAACAPPPAPRSRPGGASRALARRRRARRARYDRIFRTLKKAGVSRGRSALPRLGLHRRQRAARSPARMLHIRDDAFAQLGDSDLADGKVAGRGAALHGRRGRGLNVDDANIARARRRARSRCRATSTSPGCPPGVAFNYSARTACPRSCRATATQARLLLHRSRASATADDARRARVALRPRAARQRPTRSNAGNVAAMADEHNFVFCATHVDGHGRARTSPTRVSVLRTSRTCRRSPTALQQGMLNALYLGRLMIHPQGLAADPAFQQGGRPIVDTDAPVLRRQQPGRDHRRRADRRSRPTSPAPCSASRHELLVAAAAVGRLRRPTATILYPPTRTSSSARWSSTSCRCCGTAARPTATPQHMTDRPVAEHARAHRCSCTSPSATTRSRTYQADVEARTIGARIHTPALAPGRSPQRDPLWGIPAIPGLPWARLGDRATGTAGRPASRAPPLENVAPTERLDDPHEFPRAHARRAAAEVRLPAARRQGGRRLRRRAVHRRAGRRLSGRTGADAGARVAERFEQHRFAVPAGATEVVLVRHGASAAAVPDEPFPLLDGHGDPPLSPEGERQAGAGGRPPGGRGRARRALRDAAGPHPADRGAARGRARPGAGRRPRPARGAPGRVGGRRVPHPRGPPRPARAARADRGALGRAARRRGDGRLRRARGAGAGRGRGRGRGGGRVAARSPSCTAA